MSFRQDRYNMTYKGYAYIEYEIMKQTKLILHVVTKFSISYPINI